MIDMVLRMKTGNSCPAKLQTYLIVYGVKGYQNNVSPKLCDAIYERGCGKIKFQGENDINGSKITNIHETTNDTDATSLKQVNTITSTALLPFSTKITEKQNLSFYNQIFETFVDLVDPGGFLVKDGNGAVVKSICSLNYPNKSVETLFDFHIKERSNVYGANILFSDTISQIGDFTRFL